MARFTRGTLLSIGIVAAVTGGCKKSETAGTSAGGSPNAAAGNNGSAAGASGTPRVASPKPRPATGPATGPATATKDAAQLPLRDGVLTQAQMDALWALSDRAAAAADQITGTARDPIRQDVTAQRQVLSALAAASAGDIQPAGDMFKDDPERRRQPTFVYAVRLAIANGRADELAQSAARLPVGAKLEVAKELLQAGKTAPAATLATQAASGARAAASPDANGIAPDVLEVSRLLALTGKADEALSLLDSFKPQVPQAQAAQEEAKMVALAAAKRPADAAAIFAARLPGSLANYRPFQVGFMDATRDAARLGAGAELLAALRKGSVAAPASEMAVALGVSIAEGMSQAGQKEAAAKVLADLEVQAGSKTDLLLLLERGARASGDPAAAARIRRKLADLAAASGFPPRYGTFSLVEIYLDAGDATGARAALQFGRDKADTYWLTYILPKVIKALAEKGDRNGAVAVAEELAATARKMPPPANMLHLYQTAGLLREAGDSAGAQRLVAEARSLLAPMQKEPPNRNVDLNWPLLAAQISAGDTAGAAETSRRAATVVNSLNEPEQNLYGGGAVTTPAEHGDVSAARTAADAIKSPMNRALAYTGMIERLLGPAAERPARNDY